ncbi:drug resistance protein [Aspergillus bombycis]|uniref:Drug resistance protein n=1 Tax=Aspergillus bombycis TaxID=109264 RepID=A0A1F7ZZ34_9EURO|nr:drug resistance protein [Aspergillus bombycis]OGM44704.1 drug resistance protein [Aspergillus bombycis]
MAPNGAVLGAVFAALFAQLAWWPWAFWSMAIYCAFLTVLSIIYIPPTPSIATGLSFMRLCSELDILGAFWGVTGLVLINFAWNQAPVVGWQADYVYVLLIIGILFLVVFGVYEIRFADKPLVPFDALNLDVSFILACVACGWASFGIWVYYFWLLLKNLRDQTPLQAAAEFVPPAVTGFAASFTAGILMNKVQPGWIMLLALISFTLGNIFTAIAPVQQTYWGLTFVTLLVMPWGMDMSFPAATVVLSNAVGRSRQGVAASLVSTVVNYSISLGLGFAGTVEGHVNHGGHTPHDLLIGYRGALYLGIGLGGLGIVISLVYIFKSRLRTGSTPSAG